MRRASSRPIASPSPKPPDDPAALPRWKRSKIRSRSSGGMPAPRSATVIRASPAAECASTDTGAPRGP